MLQLTADENAHMALDIADLRLEGMQLAVG